jgi:hypothetical protein
MRFILSHRVGFVALALGALWAALAAWLSLGTIGFASPGGARLGLLPASPVAIAVVLAAAAAIVAALRAGAHPSPLSLLVLVALPWLPTRVPAAFLIWAGPIAAAVWVGVGLMLAGGTGLASSLRKSRAKRRELTPAAAVVRAGLLALLVFAASAWRAAPFVPGGDEPHYLVITQSLLLDGDLRIENNHRRGDYRAYYKGELQPHVQRRARNGELYSIHAPGLSVIVLPAFAIGGYLGVVVFLLLVSAAGSALAWWVAWLATRRTDAAWFGWAAVTLPVTAVFHSFAVYPDGPGGVLTLTGVWALLRAEDERRTASERVAPWFWHGVALSILPWLHSRFAVIAGGLGALILLRLATTRNAAAKAVAFLSAPAVSAVLWLGFFIALYGTPDPSAPYGRGEIGSLAFVPGGLAGLLFDQRFGLLPYAPVLVFAFAGLAVMILRPSSRRLGVELLFVAVPYLLTVTHFAMWWGGSSAPARFFVAALPLLAVPAGMCWVVVRDRRERALVLAALVFTALATVALVTVDRGRLAFNVRDTPALWLEWLSTASDLPQALPWWSRGADVTFARDVLIWTVVVAATVVAARRFTSASLTRTAQEVVLAWTLAVAMMIASTTVWAMRGVEGRGRTSAQLHLLHAVASTPRAVALDLDRGRRIAPDTIPRRLRIELTRPVSAGRAAGRDDRSLFDVPRMPAGEYRLTPVSETPRGWLMVGVDRDQFALRTAPIPSPPQSIDLRFPVAVRGIVVRGDEDARQTVTGIVVEPVWVMGPGEWGPAIARRAVRYGRSSVFFLDDSSFPEPEAFWVGGARSSSFVLQPDDARPSVDLRVRNGRVANHVAVDVAGRRTDLELGPGEERRLAVPIDISRGAARLTVTATGGFRPSEHDSASRDDRFLGVWMKVE